MNNDHSSAQLIATKKEAKIFTEPWLSLPFTFYQNLALTDHDFIFNRNKSLLLHINSLLCKKINKINDCFKTTVKNLAESKNTDEIINEFKETIDNELVFTQKKDKVKVIENGEVIEADKLLNAIKNKYQKITELKYFNYFFSIMPKDLANIFGIQYKYLSPIFRHK